MSNTEADHRADTVRVGHCADARITCPCGWVSRTFEAPTRELLIEIAEQISAAHNSKCPRKAELNDGCPSQENG